MKFLPKRVSVPKLSTNPDSFNEPESKELPEYTQTAYETACKMAEEASFNDEVPIGAVITKNGQVIAAQRNRILEQKDPCAHAEILAIREAAKVLGSERLTGCEMFTTLEPCAMCTGAIILARIQHVYFFAIDEKLPGLREVLALAGHNHYPQWTFLNRYGELPVRLLKDFFKKRRKEKTELGL